MLEYLRQLEDTRQLEQDRGAEESRYVDGGFLHEDLQSDEQRSREEETTFGRRETEEVDAGTRGAHQERDIRRISEE